MYGKRRITMGSQEFLRNSCNLIETNKNIFPFLWITLTWTLSFLGKGLLHCSLSFQSIFCSLRVFLGGDSTSQQVGAEETCPLEVIPALCQALLSFLLTLPPMSLLLLFHMWTYLSPGRPRMCCPMFHVQKIHAKWCCFTRSERGHHQCFDPEVPEVFPSLRSIFPSEPH